MTVSCYSERGREGERAMHHEAAKPYPAADDVRRHPHRGPRMEHRRQLGQIPGEQLFL